MGSITDWSKYPRISRIATAAAGIAWTLVPSSTTIEHPDVLTLPLGEADASWIIGLIRPPGGDNPLIAPFWQTVAELGDPALTALGDQGGAES